MVCNNFRGFMKKFIFVLSVILLSFTFLGCPFYKNLEDFNIKSPEEIVELMNQYFPTSFTLKSYYEVNESNYKYLVVKLEAEDLPQKEVKAVQFIAFPCEFEIIDELADSYSTKARTTIPSAHETFMTDYYFVKYQEELYSEIHNLYQPLLQNLTENVDYVLAIKPDLYDLPIADKQDSTLAKKRHFKNATDFLEHESLTTYLLINKEWTSEEEEIFNSFKKEVSVDINYNVEGIFYYTTKYLSSDVSIKNLENSSFYTQDDIEKHLVFKTAVWF